ncbi:hypothetical protein [Pantoea sp. B65]|uniref:hypothetical protein n=1 Tax=Pantoea sp. B65 TaxID=2813359 RepID=UPI0039B52A37
MPSSWQRQLIGSGGINAAPTLEYLKSMSCQATGKAVSAAPIPRLSPACYPAQLCFQIDAVFGAATGDGALDDMVNKHFDAAGIKPPCQTVQMLQTGNNIEGAAGTQALAAPE